MAQLQSTIAQYLNTGLPSGTVMLFVQTAAPTGWTKSATHDNKALRVVSGTAASGGSTAFTSVFASRTPTGTNSGGSVDSTTLAATQIPGHTHVENLQSSVAAMTAAGTKIGGSATGTTDRASTSSTGVGTGGGLGHTHPLTVPSWTGTALDFAVQYVDVIIATRN